MKQLSKFNAISFHLYPGIIITIGFIFLAPFVMQFGFPPQFGMLLSIILIAVPLLVVHMFSAKKSENKKNIFELNRYNQKLPISKLILYSVGLVVFAFLVWGGTQPLNIIISQKLLKWFPAWYTGQSLSGYGKNKILITLIFNLLLNGFLAPFIEEFYFRGYLLPRMHNWGKSAFALNAVLFTLYHFWQPYIYLTLFLSLLPMTWLVWKTKDIRLSILTHSLLNLIGALLSFGLLYK